jgi:UDP-N-acetylmuramoyl-tripeptide--D-alanyl-D-alanine ligase
MKQILFCLLTILSRVIIRVKKPYIIGVTATAGKTTMTHFIALFLKKAYWEDMVSISPYSYNGEYGLPLAIIWTKNPDKNPFLWLYVLLVALLRIILPYPKYLVLEYGIDHPWEMDFLLSIATPDIAIIGPISPNHIEQFWIFESYRAEKLKLAESARCIVAYGELKKYITREAVYYSLWAMSDIDASHIHQNISSLSATIHFYKNDYRVELPLFGDYQILNILPLFEVAKILSIPLDVLTDSLRHFHPEKGRSYILSGIADSYIIDGSYNGWFLSIQEGIRSTIPFMSEYQVFLLLWDMRELGDLKEELHIKIAEYINTINTPILPQIILVGELSLRYIVPVLDSKFQVFHTRSSREAWKYIRNKIEGSSQKSLIYVKGSQNTIFLEEAIPFLLRSRDETSLLCRQSNHWKRKKEEFFQTVEKE